MKKIIIFSLVGVVAITLIGVGLVSAHDKTKDWSFKGHDGAGRELMLEKKAEMFGLTVEELQEKLEEGKNFQEIFEEQGITKEDLFASKKEFMKGHLQDRLDEMVEAGKITQEQADEKLEWFGEKFQGGMMKGFHKGMRWGFHKGF